MNFEPSKESYENQKMKMEKEFPKKVPDKIMEINGQKELNDERQSILAKSKRKDSYESRESAYQQGPREQISSRSPFENPQDDNFKDFTLKGEMKFLQNYENESQIENFQDKNITTSFSNQKHYSLPSTYDRLNDLLRYTFSSHTIGEISKSQSSSFCNKKRLEKQPTNISLFKSSLEECMTPAQPPIETPLIISLTHNENVVLKTISDLNNQQEKKKKCYFASHSDRKFSQSNQHSQMGKFEKKSQSIKNNALPLEMQDYEKQQRDKSSSFFNGSPSYDLRYQNINQEIQQSNNPFIENLTTLQFSPQNIFQNQSCNDQKKILSTKSDSSSSIFKFFFSEYQKELHKYTHNAINGDREPVQCEIIHMGLDCNTSEDSSLSSYLSHSSQSSDKFKELQRDLISQELNELGSFQVNQLEQKRKKSQTEQANSINSKSASFVQSPRSKAKTGHFGIATDQGSMSKEDKIKQQGSQNEIKNVSFSNFQNCSKISKEKEIKIQAVNEKQINDQNSNKKNRPSLKKNQTSRNSISVCNSPLQLKRNSEKNMKSSDLTIRSFKQQKTIYSNEIGSKQGSIIETKKPKIISRLESLSSSSIVLALAQQRTKQIFSKIASLFKSKSKSSKNIEIVENHSKNYVLSNNQIQQNEHHHHHHHHHHNHHHHHINDDENEQNLVNKKRSKSDYKIKKSSQKKPLPKIVEQDQAHSVGIKKEENKNIQVNNNTLTVDIPSMKKPNTSQLVKHQINPSTFNTFKSNTSHDFNSEKKNESEQINSDRQYQQQQQQNKNQSLKRSESLSQISKDISNSNYPTKNKYSIKSQSQSEELKDLSKPLCLSQNVNSFLFSNQNLNGYLQEKNEGRLIESSINSTNKKYQNYSESNDNSKFTHDLVNGNKKPSSCTQLPYQNYIKNYSLKQIQIDESIIEDPYIKIVSSRQYQDKAVTNNQATNNPHQWIAQMHQSLYQDHLQFQHSSGPSKQQSYQGTQQNRRKLSYKDSEKVIGGDISSISVSRFILAAPHLGASSHFLDFHNSKSVSPLRFPSISSNCVPNSQSLQRCCGICATQDKELVESNQKCGHLFCTICLGTYLEKKISSNEVLRIRCPKKDCKVSLRSSSFKKIISDHLFKRYKQQKKILIQRQNPNIRYCTRENCNGYMIGDPEHPKLTCPQCNQEVCFHCGNNYHQGRRCDQAIEEDQEDYQADLRLACPKCRTKITLLRAKGTQYSNKNICTHCNFNFCNLCQRECGKFHFAPWNLCYGCPGRKYGAGEQGIIYKIGVFLWGIMKLVMYILGWLLVLICYVLAVAIISLFMPLAIYAYYEGQKIHYSGCKKHSLLFGLFLSGIILYPIWVVLSITPGTCLFFKDIYWKKKNFDIEKSTFIQ